MRFTIALFSLFLTLGPAEAYQNPILGPINDPDTYQEGGTYHMITPDHDHYAYRTSSDLLHWSDPQPILRLPPGNAPWQGSWYRAPGGQLYLYYTDLDATKHKSVHVAKAKDFTGPFQDLGVVAASGIDPDAFTDAKGQLWLYYKNPDAHEKGIWVAPMRDPVTPGPATEILHPQPGTFEDNGYLSIEGPDVIYRGGHYFLLYTGGPFGKYSYAVGYAVADAPDGPFVRGQNNPILSRNQNYAVNSPGVPSVVTDGAGKSWLVYRQRDSASRRSDRWLTIDPLDDSDAAAGVLKARPTSGEEIPDPVPLH